MLDRIIVSTITHLRKMKTSLFYVLLITLDEHYRYNFYPFCVQGNVFIPTCLMAQLNKV